MSAESSIEGLVITRNVLVLSLHTNNIMYRGDKSISCLMIALALSYVQKTQRYNVHVCIYITGGTILFDLCGYAPPLW